MRGGLLQKMMFASDLVIGLSVVDHNTKTGIKV